MTEEHGRPHLSAEEVQALLEGRLPDREQGAIRAHVDACARCASEVQAWQTLMEELNELPALAPSELFAERVMAQAPVKKSLLSRTWSRLREGRRTASGTTAAGRHPGPAILQEYVEGFVSGRRRARVEAHLAACDACRDETEEWDAIFLGLSSLPRLAPSSSFTDEVMARVRLPAVAPAATEAPVWTRALEAAAGLLPSTSRGWTLAGAFAAVPATAIVAAVAFLLTHPLLTVTDLTAFVWWRGAELLSGGFAWAGGWALDQAVTHHLLGVGQLALNAPGAAAATLVAAWALTAGALWVLYRNLYRPSDTAASHVHA